MTTNDTAIEIPPWKPLADRLPGFSAYEVSHRGLVRSLDRRLPDGRQIKGRQLRTRVSGTSPYLKVDLYDDQGRSRTFSVHSLVLLAYVGECPDGEESLHFNDDPLDNRWPENLGWGTHEANVTQRMQNRPALPKPVKVCVRCDAPFDGNGRRCHDCVVELGQQGARLLAGGVDIEEAAKQLDYPSPSGLFRLAVKYGDARVVIGAKGRAQHRQWIRRVMTTVRDRLEGDGHDVTECD